MKINDKPEIWASVKDVLDRIDLAYSETERDEAREEISPLFRAVVFSDALEFEEKKEPIPSIELAALSDLLTWKDGWDGKDALAPNEEVVNKAKKWLLEMTRDFLDMGLELGTPHISASAEGEVVFEWWNDPKKLTIYISTNETIFYVRIWGSDIWNEIDDNEISSLEDMLGLWMWLNRPLNTL